MALKSLLVLGGLVDLSVSLRRSEAKRKAICDENLVLETCAMLGGKTNVATEDLAVSLGISQDAAASFMQQVGMDAQAKEVSCNDLCKQTMLSFPQQQLPPFSDTGCYMEGAKKVCQTDLSDGALSAMAQEALSTRPPRQEALSIQKAPLTDEEANAMASQLEQLNEVTFADVQVQMANYFHVYPMTGGELSAAQATGGARNQRELDSTTRAYISRTMRRLNAGQIDATVRKWFGNSNGATKRLVKNGVLHIQKVMQAPHYINHPNEKGYYGWVSSPYQQSRDGTWTINLGGAYFGSNNALKIGTLTHEASHFYPLGTDDYMYCDVPGCLRMARQEPQKAQDSGDHFSFFIDEVVGGGMR